MYKLTDKDKEEIADLKAIRTMYRNMFTRVKYAPTYQGISICDEWQTFPPFYKWAISQGFERGVSSISRHFDAGNYTPLNCRLENRTDNCTSALWVVVCLETGTEMLVKNLRRWCRENELCYRKFVSASKRADKTTLDGMYKVLKVTVH